MLVQLQIASVCTRWAPQTPALGLVAARFVGTSRKTKPNRKRKLPVVLTEDVEGLGWEGKLVRVNDGYFRNQLFPRDVARYATKDDIAKAAEAETEVKAQKSAESAYDKQVASIVRMLTREPLQFSRDHKKEFEITRDHVVRGFRQQLRLAVNPEAIVMAETPRSFGEYKFDVKVDENTVATAKMVVSR